jgi:cold shock CspA family protein
MCELPVHPSVVFNNQFQELGKGNQISYSSSSGNGRGEFHK